MIKDIRDAEDNFNVKKRTRNRVFKETKNFHDFLEATNIHIYESQIIPCYIPEKSADIFFSNSVIMRPKKEKLKRMIKDASKILKEDSLA